MHHLWHDVKIKHHTQPWGKAHTWSIKVAKPNCFTYWLLGLEDCHYEEKSLSHLAFAPFRDYNKLIALPWTMNHKKLCHILESPWSHLGPDHTLDSYCQRRKKKKKGFFPSIANVITSFWSLWSSVLWLSASPSFHFKKSLSNFSVLREQHNPMVPLNPKWFKD